MKVWHQLLIIGVLIAIIVALVSAIINMAEKQRIVRNDVKAECAAAGGKMESIASRRVCFRVGALDAIIIREFSEGVDQ